MSKAHTLALDLGTHAARALRFDAAGRLQDHASRALSIRRTGTDLVEQDPDEILSACRDVIEEILTAGGLPGRAGIAVQRSSVLLWDRESGAALTPVLSWQDTRGAGRLAPLAGMAEAITSRSGLPLSPHYGASKLAWALEHTPAARIALTEDRLAMGPLAAWLLAGLREDGLAAADHANASRTQLWNLETRDWDPWLLEAFGLPAGLLPPSVPIRHDHGRLAGSGIPITALSGDQNAAALAGGEPPPGTALVNLGTGAFVLLPIGAKAKPMERMLCGPLDSDVKSASYLLEGTVNGAGAALAWAESRWNLPPLAPRLDTLPAPASTPLFINTVGGLGSPWWRHGLEPRFEGGAMLSAPGGTLDPEAERAVAAAVVESILFLIRANLDRLDRDGQPIRSLRLTGGLARSRRLCQGLADLTGQVVELPDETEATGRGIAYLAAGRPAAWQLAPAARHAPEPAEALRNRYKSWLVIMEETPSMDRWKESS